MIWSFRDFFADSYPPRRFKTAAVAIAVLGHKAFTAIWSLNYCDMPNTHIDMPYFAIV